jgi:hypothetical protein
MDKYYVLVVGNGVTSRANLEALMEDHYYANGPKGTLVLAFDGKPSQGQVFAAQLAKDKNIDILVWNTKEDAESIPPCSVTQADNPLLSAMTYIEDDKSCAFILWSDEDPTCMNALAYAKDLGIACFDLTDGLNKLVSTADIKAEEAKPVMPKVEMAETEPEEDPEDDVDEDDEDMDEEDEIYEDVYLGLEAFARLIAKAVVAEMNASNQPQKGSKA